MSTAAPFIGIDFGTTRSTMAWFNPDSGQAEVIRNAEGRDETPSVVYFGHGERLVGEPAETMLEDPEKRRMVVRSVKRDLVNQPSLALASGRVKAIDVAASILGKLRRDAEELHFHRPVQRAVLTYPAAFDEMQLDKIREAAGLAGFTEVVMVPEPVAAALAYAQSGLALGRHVLVYDLGGGTFDLALLTREPNGTFRVALPPKGLARCGGDDFDRAVYDHCDEVATATLGRGITVTAETDLFFLRQCRRRKETLSAAERCGFNAYLAGTDAPVQFSYELDRETFERLIGPTVEATVRLTGTLVQEARGAGYAVETVALIGGSSRIPLAQRRLQETLPVAPEKWQKQDVAVALGAALHGHILWSAPVVTSAQPSNPAPQAPAARTAQPAAATQPDPRPSVVAGAPPSAASAARPQASIPTPGPAAFRPAQAPMPAAAATRPTPLSPAGATPPAAHAVPAAATAPQASPAGTAATQAIPASVPAGFGPRLGAYLLDALITYLLAYAVAAVATTDSQVGTDNQPLLYALWIAAQVFYYAYCWSAGGRTIGYRATGLQVVRRDGGDVGVGTALLRYVAYILCGLPIGIGFLWMLWDPRGETWAEKLTGTVVRKAGATR